MSGQHEPDSAPQAQATARGAAAEGEASEQTPGVPGSGSAQPDKADAAKQAQEQPQEQAPAQPSLAERLGQARVGLRSDLSVSRHMFRGEASYILRDPLTFQSHRVSAADYSVITSLTAERELCSILAELKSRGEVDAEDDEDFYQFIVSLHKLGFLNLPIGDEKSLYKRHLAKRDSKRGQILKSVFFAQIPLFNPDQFLNRTIGKLSFFTSRLFFALWLGVVALAIVIAVQNWGSLSQPLGQVLVSNNIPLLWITLIGLKVVHEFGHAYACKHFGGHVPEMGIYLMAMTPCAYVDATDSWSFSSKRDRIIVCLAGMYVELFIAALACIAWSLSSPGLFQAACYNILLLASVVTIGFNINPLMRYDGYYVLADLLEVPNLRQRSTDTFKRFCKRWILNLKDDRASSDSLGLATFFLFFGAASSLYKATIVLGISAVIATKAFFIGIALGGYYLVSEIIRNLRAAAGFLLFSPETEKVRLRGICLSAILFLFVPLGILMLPLASSVRVPGVLTQEHEHSVRADSPGFLTSVLVESEQWVSTGTQLVQLEDPGSERHKLELSASIDATKLRQRAFSVEDRGRAIQEQEQLEQRQRELRDSNARLEALSPRSSKTGRVLNCPDANELGRYIARGEEIARIASGRTVVRSLFTETQIADTKPQCGQRVEFRSEARPDQLQHGTIQRIAGGGTRKIPYPALTHLAGGGIAVDPNHLTAAQSYFEVTIVLDDDSFTAPHGSTGTLLMEGDREPIGRWLLRKTLSFGNRLRHGS